MARYVTVEYGVVEHAVDYANVDLNSCWTLQWWVIWWITPHCITQ